jgi:hypothetical protein
LKQYHTHIDIADLIQLCRHDQQEGTFTIALAVALKKLDFAVSLYTDPDPNIDEKKTKLFDAQRLNIPIQAALTYAEIQMLLKMVSLSCFMTLYWVWEPIFDLFN